MEYWKKALVFCTIAWLFFSIMGLYGFYGHSSDNVAHKKMALDQSFNSNYSPLFRLISWPFAGNETLWVLWVMFLFAFITPLVFVGITKSAWAAFFYFSITSFFFWHIQGGFSQGLMLLFVAALFLTKNNYLRLLLWWIGIFSHSTAPALLTLVLAFIWINQYWKKYFAFSGSAFGCSAFWGKEGVPQAINNPVVETTISGNKVAWAGTVITENNFLTLFGKITPFPFLIVALKKLWETKRFDLIALFFCCFVAAFEVGSRAWYFFPIPLLIGFTLYFKDSSNKRFWLCMIGAWFVFQVYSWISFNLNC